MTTHIHTMLCTLAAILITTLAAPFTQAASLSVNFVDDLNGNSSYTGAGVLNTSIRTWDTMTGAGTNGFGGLNVSQTFGSTTVTVTNYANFASQTDPALDLFDGFIHSGNNNFNPSFITLSGLTGSQYNLAIYAAWGFATEDSDFTVNGTTQLTTGVDTDSFIEGNNFVLFTGLQPTAGEIVFQPGNGTDNEWLVSAFELVLIPEPSTGLLLGFGLFGLVMRRKTRLKV